jgi:hypothetical protein
VLAIGTTVDAVRTAFWETYRYLFPPHAKAVQTASGSLVITWALEGDPHARFVHSTPINIMFDGELVKAMLTATQEQRKKIAKRHEPVFKAGLVGYDPYTLVPKARVIVLG